MTLTTFSYFNLMIVMFCVFYIMDNSALELDIFVVRGRQETYFTDCCPEIIIKYFPFNNFNWPFYCIF